MRTPGRWRHSGSEIQSPHSEGPISLPFPPLPLFPDRHCFLIFYLSLHACKNSAAGPTARRSPTNGEGPRGSRQRAGVAGTQRQGHEGLPGHHPVQPSPPASPPAYLPLAPVSLVNVLRLFVAAQGPVRGLLLFGPLERHALQEVHRLGLGAVVPM